MKKVLLAISAIIFLLLGYIYWYYLSHHEIFRFVEGKSKTQVSFVTIEGNPLPLIIDDSESLETLAMSLKRARKGTDGPTAPSYDTWIQFDNGRTSRCFLIPHPNENQFTLGIEIWGSERDIDYWTVPLKEPVPSKLLDALHQMRQTKGDAE